MTGSSYLTAFPGSASFDPYRSVLFDCVCCTLWHCKCPLCSTRVRSHNGPYTSACNTSSYDCCIHTLRKRSRGSCSDSKFITSLSSSCPVTNTHDPGAPPRRNSIPRYPHPPSHRRRPVLKVSPSPHPFYSIAFPPPPPSQS
jgi:hypothetical protein